MKKRNMKYCIPIAAAAFSLTLAVPLSQPAQRLISVNSQTQNVKRASIDVTPTATVTPVATPAIVAAVQSTPVPSPQTPVPVPIVLTSGCEQYRGLIAQYDWNVNTAVAICQAESGGDPSAISPLNTDGLRDYGLFQIHGEEILNPAANVARAYRKYIDQGWEAWSTFNSGKYLQFL